MNTLSFEKLPEAVAELHTKVDELFRVLNRERPREEKYLTVEEASKFLHVTIPTIYGYASKRKIPYIKNEKRLIFLREDLEAYLKSGRRMTDKEIESEADQYLAGKGGRA